MIFSIQFTNLTLVIDQNQDNCISFSLSLIFKKARFEKSTFKQQNFPPEVIRQLLLLLFYGHFTLFDASFEK